MHRRSQISGIKTRHIKIMWRIFLRHNCWLSVEEMWHRTQVCIFTNHQCGCSWCWSGTNAGRAALLSTSARVVSCHCAVAHERQALPGLPWLCLSSIHCYYFLLTFPSVVILVLVFVIRLTLPSFFNYHIYLVVLGFIRGLKIFNSFSWSDSDKLNR